MRASGRDLTPHERRACFQAAKRARLERQGIDVRREDDESYDERMSGGRRRNRQTLARAYDGLAGRRWEERDDRAVGLPLENEDGRILVDLDREQSREVCLRQLDDLE